MSENLCSNRFQIRRRPALKLALGPAMMPGVLLSSSASA
jgi:hypothetical protein